VAQAEGVGHGNITATAVGRGESGNVTAISIASDGAQTLSSAKATALAGGSSGYLYANTQASNGGAAQLDLSALYSPQSLSRVTGDPGDSAALLASTSNVAATLAEGDVRGSGVLGASYSADGVLAGGSQTYLASGQFQFQTTQAGHLVVGWLSTFALNSGFDAFSLSVNSHGTLLYTQTFTSSSEADSFFTDRTLDLGLFGAGAQDLEIATALTTYGGTSGGFGLRYVVGSVAVTAVPEPSTWALSLAGLMLLLLQRRRQQRHINLEESV
jgi:hypothetical protein